MQKFILTAFTLFCFCCNPAVANDFNRYSNDAQIISALSTLQSIKANDVFERLNDNSVKICFYDLSQIDFAYSEHYAVSSVDEDGNNYILINQQFRNAPKEAIACLIAHESVHVLPKSTLNEEVEATTTEAQTWLKLKNKKAYNSKNDLVLRENQLLALYQNSRNGKDLIREDILNNTFYQHQLAMK